MEAMLGALRRRSSLLSRSVPRRAVVSLSSSGLSVFITHTAKHSYTVRDYLAQETDGGIVLVKIRSLSSAPVLLRYFTFIYGSITSYPLREKLTIWNFLAVWQGHRKLFVFIPIKFVQQTLFTQIGGLCNPPMKPEANVIINIYTRSIRCRRIKRFPKRLAI